MLFIIVEGSGGGRSPIRIRNVQTLRSIVYVRCILIGGPYDIYYMVRPESKERNDPDERTVMRFGEKVVVMFKWVMNRLVTLKIPLLILLWLIMYHLWRILFILWLLRVKRFWVLLEEVSSRSSMCSFCVVVCLTFRKEGNFVYFTFMKGKSWTIYGNRLNDYWILSLWWC